MSSTSTVSILNPAFVSSPPMSRTSARGETWVETPPLRSRSASWREVRSSNSESPPSMAARNGESGCRMRAIWAKIDGSSLIQCMDNEESAAEKEAGTKGSGAVSGIGRMVRVCEGIRALKGRSTSRWRRVGEESAEVRDEIRSVTGGDESVRARAMLHALAPKSRTVGNCRLISCRELVN